MNSDRKPGHLLIDNKSKYLYHGCLLVFYSVTLCIWLIWIFVSWLFIGILHFVYDWYEYCATLLSVIVCIFTLCVLFVYFLYLLHVCLFFVCVLSPSSKMEVIKYLSSSSSSSLVTENHQRTDVYFPAHAW